VTQLAVGLAEVEQEGGVATQLIGLLEAFDRLLPVAEVVLAPSPLRREACCFDIALLSPGLRDGGEDHDGYQHPLACSVQRPAFLRGAHCIRASPLWSRLRQFANLSRHLDGTSLEQSSRA